MRKRGLSQIFVSAYALTVLAISEKFQSLYSEYISSFYINYSISLNISI